MGQIIYVLSAIMKDFRDDKNENFFDRAGVSTFLASFLTNQMKNDILHLIISNKVKDFLEANGIHADKISKITDEQNDELRSLLSSPDEGGYLNDVYRFLGQTCLETGLEEQAFELVYQSLLDIITGRPVTKDGPLAKLDNVNNKIKLENWPEGYSEEEPNIRAIVRIKIPLEEKKQEVDEEDDNNVSRDETKSKMS